MRLRDVLIVLVLSASLLLPNLGRVSLWNNNEPRYAHTARNMILTGDYLVPRLKGEIRYDKPILTYWLIVTSSKIVSGGRVTEFSARLPFVICGMLCLVVVYLFGEALFSPEVGLMGSILLLLTNEFVITARRALPDMALCLFVTLAVLLLYLGLERRGFIPWAWLACAFAFLTKGPVGVLIPFAVLGLYTSVNGNLRDFLFERRHLFGFILFVAVALPWFVAADHGFLAKFLLMHNIKHFAKGLDHVKPWYFYFLAAPFCFAPVVLFWPSYFRRWRSLPFIWASFVFLFFTMAAAKRVVYLLPMAPPLALMAAHVCHRVVTGEAEGVERLNFNVAVFSCIGALLVSPVLSILVFKYRPPLFAASLVVLGAMVAMFVAVRGGHSLRFWSLVSLLFFSYLVYFGWVLPDYDARFRDARPLAEAITAQVGSAPLYRLGSYDAALEFYLGRPFVPKVGCSSLGRLNGAFVVGRVKDYRRCMKEVKGVKLHRVFVMSNRGREFVLFRVGGEGR